MKPNVLLTPYAIVNMDNRYAVAKRHLKSSLKPKPKPFWKNMQITFTSREEGEGLERVLNHFWQFQLKNLTIIWNLPNITFSLSPTDNIELYNIYAAKKHHVPNFPSKSYDGSRLKKICMICWYFLYMINSSNSSHTRTKIQYLIFNYCYWHICSSVVTFLSKRPGNKLYLEK